MYGIQFSEFYQEKQRELEMAFFKKDLSQKYSIKSYKIFAYLEMSASECPSSVQIRLVLTINVLRSAAKEFSGPM